MISKNTYVYLQEFKKMGTLTKHITQLRYQLISEQVIYGLPQIPTLNEIESAVAILDGTFDERKDLI